MTHVKVPYSMTIYGTISNEEADHILPSSFEVENSMRFNTVPYMPSYCALTWTEK
jgi:hypothetical protein